MPSEYSAPESGRNTPPPSGRTPDQWHRYPGQPSPSNKQGSTSTDLDAPSLRGHLGTEGSGPVFGPCARPNPEAEAKAEAESRRGPRLLRAKSSDPRINRDFTASGT
jgi:hypothetical protein